MVCLDTDFLIALLRFDAETREKLELMVREDAELTTTVINVCELLLGAQLSGSTEKVRKTEGIISRLRILNLDYRAAEIFGRLASEMRRKGQGIGDMDTLIASIVIANNELLCTKNKTHFQQVPGLILDSW